jgi:uncharacterized protein YjbI with pentapeptide repeats
MSISLDSGCYRADNANLARSQFRDVDLSDARFNDVNLRGAAFVNVALTNAAIRDACLSNVTIADANYEGMRIEGILVTELLRVHQEHSAAAQAPEP